MENITEEFNRNQVVAMILAREVWEGIWMQPSPAQLVPNGI